MFLLDGHSYNIDTIFPIVLDYEVNIDPVKRHLWFYAYGQPPCASLLNILILYLHELDVAALLCSLHTSLYIIQ